MDEARLSERERRILAEIERDLSEDVGLERGLRTMGRRRRRLRAGRRKPEADDSGGTPGRRMAGRPALGTAGGTPDRTSARPGRRGHALAVSVALLGLLALGLLVVAVATATTALIWAFAAVWSVTLIGLLCLVVRWSRRLKPWSWPP
ncbi:hypothetical protein ACIPPS_13345 [Streptomyces sp. NPDC090127]|uniref:hypothetical protein n=1 Tax=Streptomyces sp. NPDC090127 TaxID=3365953 RepID=UPI0038011F2A